MSQVPVLKIDECFERLMVRVNSVAYDYRTELVSFAPVHDALSCRPTFGKRKVAPQPKAPLEQKVETRVEIASNVVFLAERAKALS